jgi:hypothetical protein
MDTSQNHRHSTVPVLIRNLIGMPGGSGYDSHRYQIDFVFEVDPLEALINKAQLDARWAHGCNHEQR